MAFIPGMFAAIGSAVSGAVGSIGSAIGGIGAAGGGAASGATGIAGALQTVAPIASIAGTGLSAVGAIQAGKAEARAAEFNAKVAEQQAASERDAASAEASDFRRRQQRLMSEGRAARGATGVTGAGSPLLVDEATVREIALGSSRIQHQGTLRAGRLTDEATLSRSRGSSARAAGNLRAGSTLLTGIADFGTGFRTV